MVTTNDSYLQLNIVPVAKVVPNYDKDQLYVALEDEYYAIRDNVELAILELERKLALENANTVVDTSTDGYEYFPLDKSGIVFATPDDYVMLTTSYNADGNAVSWGLPDSLGSRFGAFQLPWEDTVVGAGTGGRMPVLERFLEKYNILRDVTVNSPAFESAWKNFSDKVFLKQKQSEYIISETQNFLGRLTRTTDNFKNWNITNLPIAVLSTVQRVFTQNNLNIFKGMSFFSNAFRGTSDVSTLSNADIVSKLNTEALFGADKYIPSFARNNVIPMDYNDLQQARAEGLIRQKLLGDALVYNPTADISGFSQEDIRKAVFKDYSIDQHIQNRMEGILAGEEPLPNMRGTINSLDSNGNVISKVPMSYGYSGEYVDTTGDKRGVGGLPGSSDYHPLAIGDTVATPIEKRIARAVTDIPTASGDTWSEPSPAYAAEYPNNIVTEHPSGIVTEIDNTPGQERIHIYHPSHTIISIDKEGNMTIRNAKDKFELIDRDLKEYVKNNMDTTVKGNKGLKVVGNLTEEVAEMKTTVSGDKSNKVSGSMTNNVSGTMTNTVSSDKTDNVSGSYTETVSGDKRITAGTIYLNC